MTYITCITYITYVTYVTYATYVRKVRFHLSLKSENSQGKYLKTEVDQFDSDHGFNSYSLDGPYRTLIHRHGDDDVW